MHDIGSGNPVILIPGVQGHWEWMRPAVESLARHGCRVVTDSLPGERSSLARWDASRGFDQFVDHVDAVLASANLDRAVVCGVSLGGLIALRYAARRPARVAGLVLVSTPPPGWTLPRHFARDVAYPRMSLPFFVAGAAARARVELSATFPRMLDRLRFSRRNIGAVIRHPIVATRAAARVRAMDGEVFEADCRAVRAPSLVMTGEDPLDRVVPVADTLAYCRLLPGCEYVRLDRTGHLGVLTKPDAFAAHVAAFADRVFADAAAARRRYGS